MTGKRRTSLPRDAWPERDRALWEQAISDGGYFKEAGKAAHWAPATKKQVAKGYSKWAYFLAEAGSLDPSATPTDRATPERLETYVHWLEDQDLSSITIASRFSDLREALRVMEPEADIGVLTSMMIKLRARESPRRKKHIRIEHPREIRERAFAYLAKIPDLECINDRVRAGWYRDGVAVAFLAARPIRLKNLASLRIGHNFIRGPEGWACDFPANETKERCPLSFSLSSDLCAVLDHYIEVYRPRLLGSAPSDYLWISIRGALLSQQAHYIGISLLTSKLFGHPINPHLFRDCAATAIATEDPEHVLAAARILGHGSIEMTIKSYNQSLMVNAVERLHETLIALKNEEPRS